MDTEEHSSAASRYEQLQSDRQHFIDRADKAAKLTIPTLFIRDTSSTKNMKVKDPAASTGARGVNTLASKMVLSLLPMNTPFFKLNVDLLALKEEGQDEQRVEIEKGLGTIERAVLRDIENSGDVTTAFEMLKHLIVVGNALLFVGAEGSRMFDLNKYVVVRDPQGKVMEIVVCEETAPTALSDEQKALSVQDQNSQSNDKSVKVYTHIKFADRRVTWHQEVFGKKVLGSEGDVPEEGNPWIALRFMRIDGEDYGRSYVDMYLGDLESLEVLVTAVRDAAVSASKVLWLVRPNGTTNPKVVASAPNNSVRTGSAEDVTVLRMDKGSDLRIAENLIGQIKQQLAYAFMINAEVMRDAERVTAEEVRFVAQELDDSLGGLYSLLSKEFQTPYIHRRLHLMRKANRIPKLPSIVDPVIVTGFAALGRGHDRDKLMRFAKTLVDLYGPQELPKYINVDELNSRLAVADGIETQGLLITAETRAANEAQSQQQAQSQQMIEKLGPEVLRQAGPALAQQATPQEGAPSNGP